MTTNSNQRKRKEPPGERLLLSLFNMTRAVNLYHATNQRMFDTIDMFREAIEEIRKEAGAVDLRLHNGRFYLNRQLVSCPPAAFASLSKLADYLQARGVRGFRFVETEKLWDEQVITFVELLNRADREKEPLAWLQSNLRGDDFAWIALLAEQDSEPAARDGGQVPSAGGGGPAGGGRRADESERAARRQALAESAREAYSQALTAMLNTLGKLPSQKRVSVQRTKRIIQNMIDILFDDETVLLGLGTIRDYDDYTYTHSVNVAILSMCLGKRIGLPRATIEQIGLCGLFHDLGKVDVPVELITKPARLTPDEYEQVKKHPMYSIRQILRLNADREMKSKFLLAPFEHHIGVDLSGYPQTHRRVPPSLLGRILSIADHYDALTSNRSYRSTAYSPDVALRIMVEEAGGKLDPILLKAFIDLIGVHPVGSFLELDTGEFGLVAEVPDRAEQGRPIIVLLHQNDGEFILGDRVDLAEPADGGVGFKRNIVCCIHPSEYGIQPANFLI